MKEAALVFSLTGETIYWHAPASATAVYLPDSPDLWSVLWEHRAIIGGIAHLHPWNGHAAASQTDLTTFAACEDGIGRRLIWPIFTFTQELHFGWTGPGRLDYTPGLNIIQIKDGERLRDLGRKGD